MGKIFANHLLDEELFSIIFKECSRVTKKPD
jgi:hypothetical protein